MKIQTVFRKFVTFCALLWPVHDIAYCLLTWNENTSCQPADVQSAKTRVWHSFVSLNSEDHLLKYIENFTTKKWKFSDKKFWYFS